MDNVFLILIIAVAGPFLGALIGVLKRPSELVLFNMLSFAAGTMLAISFLKLIPESIAFSSILLCVLGILIGSLVTYVLDKLIPHIHVKSYSHAKAHGKRINRVAIYIIVGMFLHNFPEGMAIAIGFVSDFKLSIAIAIAVAIHDIPEGICTSAPYYYTSRNRLKSFLLAVSTAIPTVIGFGFSYFLYQFIPLQLVGLFIAATAGIMIYISADELIPISYSRGTHHSTIFSLMAGIALVILLGFL
jgi:zinc transporter, ZIP family